jgi:AmmeMemoRadiSam system protein B
LAAAKQPEVMVLFGGVHRYRGREAALFGTGRWETPLGPVEIDARLAERILGHTNLIVDDPYAHEDEHSLEVQMPFIRHLFPAAKVVPLMVPVNNRAHEVGEAVGRTLSAYDYDALVVGTTDLTHYGPGYGFAPEGVGADGNSWAKEINDRRFIELVCQMKATELVAEATVHKNACNAGATAATVAAVQALGATQGVLLEHTTSSEVLAGKLGGDSHDSVGYAGIIFR